jgi:prophage regulatory protein
MRRAGNDHKFPAAVPRLQGRGPHPRHKYPERRPYNNPTITSYRYDTVKPLYLELEAAAASICLSPSTLQRMVREGAFPAPRQLSGRRVGWLTREVEEWAEARPVADQLPPENTSRRGKTVTLAAG